MNIQIFDAIRKLAKQAYNSVTDRYKVDIGSDAKVEVNNYRQMYAQFIHFVPIDKVNQNALTTTNFPNQCMLAKVHYITNDSTKDIMVTIYTAEKSYSIRLKQNETIGDLYIIELRQITVQFVDGVYSNDLSYRALIQVDPNTPT